MPRPRDIQARHCFAIGRHAGRLVKRSPQETLASAAPEKETHHAGRASAATPAGQASSLRQEKFVTPAGQRRHFGRASAVICQDKPDAPAQQASPLRQDKLRHYGTARVASPTGQALSLWPGQRHRSGIASTATTARQAPSLQQNKRRRSDRASTVTPTRQAPPLQRNKRHLADRVRAATSAGSVATPTGQGRCFDKASAVTPIEQAHHSGTARSATPAGSVSPLRQG